MKNKAITFLIVQHSLYNDQNKKPLKKCGLQASDSIPNYYGTALIYKFDRYRGGGGGG